MTSKFDQAMMTEMDFFDRDVTPTIGALRAAVSTIVNVEAMKIQEIANKLLKEVEALKFGGDARSIVELKNLVDTLKVDANSYHKVSTRVAGQIRTLRSNVNRRLEMKKDLHGVSADKVIAAYDKVRKDAVASVQELVHTSGVENVTELDQESVWDAAEEGISGSIGKELGVKGGQGVVLSDVLSPKDLEKVKDHVVKDVLSRV